jgi:hypothetical protein
MAGELGRQAGTIPVDVQEVLLWGADWWKEGKKE